MSHLTEQREKQLKLRNSEYLPEPDMATDVRWTGLYGTSLKDAGVSDHPRSNSVYAMENVENVDYAAGLSNAAENE